MFHGSSANIVLGSFTTGCSAGVQALEVAGRPRDCYWHAAQQQALQQRFTVAPGVTHRVIAALTERVSAS
jgi:hypothetical protein